MVKYFAEYFNHTTAKITISLISPNSNVALECPRSLAYSEKLLGK